MTAQTLDTVVREYRAKKYNAIDMTSRLSVEDALSFTARLAQENGQNDLCTDIIKLMTEVDRIDTDDLVKVGTFI